MQWLFWGLATAAAGYGVYRVAGPMQTGPAPGMAADMTLEGLMNTFNLNGFDDTLQSAKFVTELEEGKHLRVYRDSRGFRTIGIGFNMDAAGAQSAWARAGVKTSFTLALNNVVPITESECAALFALTFMQAESDSRQIFPNYNRLGKWQKVALIGMVFQMGRAGVAAFRNTLGALAQGNGDGVYTGVMGSAWARQTPARARRAAMMLAYNRSHEESERILVAQGLISNNQRKYA